ncbi:MAG: hypothetical protein DMG32_22095 [Acidobacteria bacterium]|nr:MAG: hypothetical protein DMG32_22095 [Acidobacteriota bacterium]
MASSDYRIAQLAARSGLELPLELDDSLSQAAVSTALVSVFRGKFCDAILPNRKTTTFKKEEVIYDVGGKERTFFFLQDGFVKVGTITSDGHELIYDVRKGGDVVGELCASETRRPDRAVALEQTKATDGRGTPRKNLDGTEFSSPQTNDPVYESWPSHAECEGP